MDVTTPEYHRPAVLQNFLDRLEAFISARSSPDEAAALAARRIFDRLKTAKSEASAPDPRQYPVCAGIDDAIAAIPPADAQCRDLGRSLQALVPALAWTKRQGLAAGPDFEDGHANAVIIGPTGIETRRDAWVGVSVMAPNITYPDHHHPPEEVYVVLSSGDWRQGDGAWRAPGVGGIVYNPPDIVHAMRSGDGALVAVWCLPLG